MEFKSFDKIQQIGKLMMSITQKIHGTNAQICVFKNGYGRMDVLAGSRNRWLSVDDDNYGFAAFVEANKQEIIEKLGEGRHFGEWAGPGINGGEGLSEKTFYLFNWRRWKDHELPPRTSTVPVLYVGKADLDQIDLSMNLLKEGGSKISPGYMIVEGVVVEIGDCFYKKVFNPEETAWKQTEKKIRAPRPEPIDVSHLLQPIRLEKMLSRDEAYRRNYPESLPLICKDYMVDLFSETEIKGSEDEVKVIKKELGRNLFKFVKENIK